MHSKTEALRAEICLYTCSGPGSIVYGSSSPPHQPCYTLASLDTTHMSPKDCGESIGSKDGNDNDHGDGPHDYDVYDDDGGDDDDMKMTTMWRSMISCSQGSSWYHTSCGWTLFCFAGYALESCSRLGEALHRAPTLMHSKLRPVAFLTPKVAPTEAS